MKKIMIALGAACLIVLVSSFNLSTSYSEDARYYLLDEPMEDVCLAAIDCVSREPVNVVMCPGDGYKCVATVKVAHGTVTMTSQKGANRKDVERVEN